MLRGPYLQVHLNDFTLQTMSGIQGTVGGALPIEQISPFHCILPNSHCKSLKFSQEDFLKTLKTLEQLGICCGGGATVTWRKVPKPPLLDHAEMPSECK